MNALPGNIVYLIRVKGHKRTYTPVMIYSISPKRREIKLHGMDTVFHSNGKPKDQPSWAPEFWIEPISPALMTEMRETMNEE